MKTINISLDADETNRMAAIDKTIRAQSTEFGMVMLKADAIKSQLSGLYGARNQLVQEKIEKAEIDQKLVRNVNITEDGQLAKLEVMIEEAEPEASKIIMPD